MTPAALAILAAYLRREAPLFGLGLIMAKPAPISISAADKAAALKLTPVSRETEVRLDRYVDLLMAWQAKTNLIAPSTLPQLWTRHISDSLQLLDLARMPGTGSTSAAAADFRGGAGLRNGGVSGCERPACGANRQEGRLPARGAAGDRRARLGCPR
jgi:hypothetical protein